MALRLEHLFDQGLAASPQAAALLKSSRGKTRRRVSASRATFAAIRATLQRLVVKDEDKTSMEVKDGDESSTTKDTIQPSTTSHSITNTQYPSLAIRWEERRQRMTQLTLEEKQMSVREPNESIPASAEEIAALAKELRGLETGMLQRVAARAGVAAGRLDLRSLEPKQQRQLMEELQRVKEEEFLASGSERED